jgi:peptidoglycan hydrolase CwlO-like protein
MRLTRFRFQLRTILILIGALAALLSLYLQFGPLSDEARRARLQREFEKNLRTINTLQQQILNNQQKIDEKQREREEIQQKIDEKQREREETHQKIDEKQRKIEALEQKINRLKQGIHEPPINTQKSG